MECEDRDEAAHRDRAEERARLGEWISPKGRVRFDKAVGELYAVLAKKRRQEEGKRFRVNRALEDLQMFATNMKDFELRSSYFEQSIALLEFWYVNDSTDIKCILPTRNRRGDEVDLQPEVTGCLQVPAPTFRINKAKITTRCGLSHRVGKFPS